MIITISIIEEIIYMAMMATTIIVMISSLLNMRMKRKLSRT